MMNPKGNPSTPSIGKRIRSPTLRDDESIREALEEYMPESDSQARRVVEDSINAFINKKRNDPLFARTFATLSFPGPSSSVTRNIPLVTPLVDPEFPATQALLSPPGKSSEGAPCDILLLDSDFESDEYESEHNEGIEDGTKNGMKQTTSRKRSAFPREPSCERSRKKIRASVERSEWYEMKKELILLEIKNKELDIKAKEALINYYRLKSFRLETQLGTVPSASSVAQAFDQ